MGNMGNPVITRLGITQIWYKKWYNNSNYAKTLKQVYTFEKLIKFYFKYGIFYYNNLFNNNFWYKNKSLIAKKSTTPYNNILYFRKYYFSHRTLTIEHTYSIRNNTPEYFPLKLFIIKYNSWFIISVQWFKPFKAYSRKTINKQRHNNFNNKKLILSTPKVYKSRKSSKKRLLISLLLMNFLVKNCSTSIPSIYNF
jgi:hypothetical protein